MQIGSSTYKQSFGSGVLEPTVSLRLGGKNVTKQLMAWELDRSYSSDLPQTMRAFAGSSAAQFKYTLSGTGGKSGPKLYSAWAPRSTGDITRPGQSVVFQYGYMGSTLPAFRGTVRRRSAASGSAVITASALDGAERLRNLAAVPRPYTTTVWNQWVLSPSLLVDHLLRDAGIYSSPPPRFRNCLFVSGHDGIYPYNGSYALTGTGSWSTTRSNAPFVSMAKPQSNVSTNTLFYPRYRPTENGLNSGLWAEFFTNNTDFMAFTNKSIEFAFRWENVDPAGPDSEWKLSVDFGTTLGAFAGNVSFSFVEPAGSSGVGFNFDNTQTGRYHFALFCNPDITTGLITYECRVTHPNGSVTYPSPGVAPSYTADYNRYLDNILITSMNLPFENFQFCKTGNTPPANTNAGNMQSGQWVRAAYFPDANQFPLQYFPDVQGSTWDVITTIAKATLATAEFDENGQFRWREFTQFTGSPVADLNVTSKRDISSLTVTEEIDACRNFVQVAASDFSGIPVGPTKLFASTGNPSIAAGASLSFVFPVDGSFEFDPVVPPRLANTAVSSGNWVTAMNVASGGNDSNIIKTDVEIEGFHNQYGQYQVNVYNQSGSTIWLYKSGGSGSGVLMEIPYDDSGFAAKIVNVTSENTVSQGWYGKQAYYHDPGPWIQWPGFAALTVADAILNAGAYPVPLLENVEIIPDARLQLGDVVQVIDRVGAELDTKAWIVGINTSGNSGGELKQRLTLRGVSYPGTPVDSGLTPDPPVDPTAGSTT